MSKPKKSWHDDMVTIWVSTKTRKWINQARLDNPKLKTADDVIEMLIAKQGCKENKTKEKK